METGKNLGGMMLGIWGLLCGGCITAGETHQPAPPENMEKMVVFDPRDCVLQEAENLNALRGWGDWRVWAGLGLSEEEEKEYLYLGRLTRTCTLLILSDGECGYDSYFIPVSRHAPCTYNATHLIFNRTSVGLTTKSTIYLYQKY